MTATHSHGSPFAPVENGLCLVLFGSPDGVHEEHDHHHHHHHDDHEVSHAAGKSKEDLNEGTRKRKVKKAE